jgi:hypothetical protein
MPDEIITNLYTSGGEFETEDGKEYRGMYHRYLTNEIYTESNWDPRLSKKLKPLIRKINKDTPYADLKRNLKTNFLQPTPALINVSQADRKVGYVSRYFLKKINESLFIEIDALQFKAWQNGRIDPNSYFGVEIRWYVSGLVNDEKQGVVLIKGVYTKNTEQIAYAERFLPGISSILTDPLQYYADDTFIIPPDINQR